VKGMPKRKWLRNPDKGKQRQIESFKEYAKRNAKKKGRTLPEEENEDIRRSEEFLRDSK